MNFNDAQIHGMPPGFVYRYDTCIDGHIRAELEFYVDE
jgi:hypothetical protein